MRHKRVRRELYGWSCAACAVRCGVPERARGGAWPPEAGRLAPARPAPACVPRPVRLHIPGLCRCARLGLRRLPAGPGPCRRACRGLCRLVCRPARPRLVWRLARARLVGRSARRPVPACLYVPACRGFTCWGLCRLVCRGLHARLVGRLLAASGCRCGGPGLWAGPGVGLCGGGGVRARPVGGLRRSASALWAVCVPWSACRVCGTGCASGCGPAPGGRLPRRFVCRVPRRSVCSPSCRPRGRVCRVRVSGFRRCVCGC